VDHGDLARVLLPLLALSVAAVTGAATADEVTKPRLIVLTDIGGDPDGQQSMVRLLLYANEFDIEGLIARATVWRRRPHFQNHFQARMDWCVKPRDRANHAPLAVCNGDGEPPLTSYRRVVVRCK